MPVNVFVANGRVLRSRLRKLLLLSLLLITGCGLLENKKEDPDLFETTSMPLIPLEVGNYWVYHQWEFSPDFLVTVREEVISRHDVVVNGVKAVVYGRQRFPIELGPDPDGAIWLAASGSLNGVHGHYQFGSIVPGNPPVENFKTELRFKYPAELGDTWELPGLVYTYENLTLQGTVKVELVGINETFETEFGRFEGCFVYRNNSFMHHSIDYYYWYVKPGIGVVGGEVRHPPEIDEGQVSGQWTLIDYHLN